MKTKLKTTWTVIVALMLLTACTRTVNNPNDNNNSSNNSSNNTASATANIGNGTWTVSSYTERAENKTSDYAGTAFVFASNGTVTASGSNSGTGTWSISGTTLTINFPSGRPLDRLNEPWKIVENTSTVVRLDHPEANEDEHVTFSKK